MDDGGFCLVCFVVFWFGRVDYDFDHMTSVGDVALALNLERTDAVCCVVGWGGDEYR